jgi:hypothetical protein
MYVCSNKLPTLREKLRGLGVLDRMEIAPGYLAVLKEASSRET